MVDEREEKSLLDFLAQQQPDAGASFCGVRLIDMSPDQLRGLAYYLATKLSEEQSRHAFERNQLAALWRS